MRLQSIRGESYRSARLVASIEVGRPRSTEFIACEDPREGAAGLDGHRRRILRSVGQARWRSRVGNVSRRDALKGVAVGFGALTAASVMPGGLLDALSATAASPTPPTSL